MARHVAAVRLGSNQLPLPVCAATPSRERPLFQYNQQPPAGLFAAPARLGTDPAVLVPGGMPIALVPTCPAGGYTRLK